MAGQPRRDAPSNQRSHPRRHGRHARRSRDQATSRPPAQALERTLRRPTGTHLGLGDPAVRIALARQLGHRGPRRPAPVRALVEKARCLAHPPQPARRADADASLRAVALLRLLPALPQRPLSEDRRRRRRGEGPARASTPARTSAQAQPAAPHRLRPGLPAQDEGARSDLSGRARAAGTHRLRPQAGTGPARLRHLQCRRRGARTRVAELARLPPPPAPRRARAQPAPPRPATRGAGPIVPGIRFDAVMGLFRLFWLPEGMTAAQGAYVRYPAATLLALLASESRRARAFVVGEDLGLVQPAVRRHLRRRGSLSYRLLWFEGSEPRLWPRDAVAAVGTHDLPTVAGIWTQDEPERRLHHLREKLVTMTQLPDATAPVDVAVAAYTELARGRPRIVLASLEDALGVSERPNVPGTTTEFPNWRLALPASLEEIETADGVNRIANAMAAAGRSANLSRVPGARRAHS